MFSRAFAGCEAYDLLLLDCIERAMRPAVLPKGRTMAGRSLNDGCRTMNEHLHQVREKVFMSRLGSAYRLRILSRRSNAEPRDNLAFETHQPLYNAVCYYKMVHLTSSFELVRLAFDNLSCSARFGPKQKSASCCAEVLPLIRYIVTEQNALVVRSETSRARNLLVSKADMT